ncbi:hypothetical protein [Streptomyces sp. NPDC049887]|uniref:hypothetical protein n=1 Tax=Streptomyces sp. NPDC049887 TaxID=3155654 RepID=UPI003423F5C0
MTVSTGEAMTLPDGTVIEGKIVFTAPDVVTIGADDYVFGGAASATLTAGEFSIVLCATDATGIGPSGWTYKVSTQFVNAPNWTRYISLPKASASVILADVLIADPATAEFTTLANPDLFLAKASDLSDLASVSTARTNLGLGTSATIDEDALTIAQSQVTGLTAGLDAKADLTGATFTGAVTLNGADLSVLGTGKGYRFRRGGGALDLEATGSDLLISNWSGTAFDGTQRSYMRLSADALNTQIAGKVEFVEALYGATRHVLDGSADTLAFHGATPVAKQTVTGSRGDGSALASLLTALANLGLITDSSTA